MSNKIDGTEYTMEHIDELKNELKVLYQSSVLSISVHFEDFLVLMILMHREAAGLSEVSIKPIDEVVDAETPEAEAVQGTATEEAISEKLIQDVE